MIKSWNKLLATIVKVTEDDSPSFEASAIFYTEVDQMHMAVRGVMKSNVSNIID
jgi:hypothetical protein